jgi:hypothetical protein
VYVDDMPVKSIRATKHIEDLRETFQTLKKYKMKLNPMKCAFRVSLGKILGFMVSQRGIKANPEKVKAVLEMEAPRTMKQLQRLTGRIAALNRFISRSTDKCLHGAEERYPRIEKLAFALIVSARRLGHTFRLMLFES